MGRKREFDVDDALGAATAAFWRSGYDATSLSALVKATGVAPKGLYAAFGNKEALFARCLDRYTQRHMAFVDRALAAATPRAVISEFLTGYVDLLTSSVDHPGCLAMNAQLAGDDSTEAVRTDLVQRRAAFETRLASRLATLSDWSGAVTSAETIARFVVTFVQGMAVQAKGGVSKSELRSLATVVTRVIELP